jgi:hypothetical protein
MEFLRPPGLAERFKETVFRPEVAMFANARGAILSSRAPLVDLNLRHRSLGEAALVAVGLLFVCAVAVLFGLWLTSLDRNRSTATGSLSDCTSFGRGGAHCAAPAEKPGAAHADAYPHQVCVSLGRGGAICGPYPDAKGVNP